MVEPTNHDFPSLGWKIAIGSLTASALAAGSTSCSSLFRQESFDYNPYYLTSTEIYRLYCCFGHLLAKKLYRVLKRSKHDDVDKKAINYLTKYCSFCQKYRCSLGRFKFTLYKDLDFNYLVYIDIIYINSSPVLYIIDEVTYY